MSKYVYLEQLADQLPLLDKELIYADVSSICFRSPYKLTVNDDQQNIINFYRAVHSEGAYPRFNVGDYCYKITPDNDVTTLIDLSHIQPSDFDNITDSKSIELKNRLHVVDRVFLFWSGGIDSTVILSAILKNWSQAELTQLTVVCNQHSINENPNFYKKFIEHKLNTVSSDLFFKNEITFNSKSLYVSGDSGDTMASYTELEKFNNLFPDIYLNSYKKHSKEIIKFFGNNETAYYSYKRIVQSLKNNNLEFDTVFDFLWWIEFNWAYPLEVFYMLWSYSLVPEHIDTKSFMTQNVVNWFGDTRYQHWAMSTVGTDCRVNKHAYKKYIYEVDKDLEYFLYKKRVGSIPLSRNSHHGKKVVAIDKDWTLYYL